MTTTPNANLVWHYTTLETLEKILGSQSLLATEANFQNDPMEVSYAQGLIRAALNRSVERHGSPGDLLTNIARHFDDPGHYNINITGLLETSRFLLCGSADGDSMYCWRTYGSIGSVGCAIGLDSSIPLGIAESHGDHQSAWKPVSYSAADLEAQVDNLIDEVVADYLATGTDQDAPNFGELITGYSRVQALIQSAAKSPSYRDEKESRVTITRPPARAITFGAGRSGPRPRVALTTVGASLGGASENDYALPIREIRLSPTSPRGAEQSLRWILATHDYSIDGVPEFDEYIDESGNTGRNMHLNQDRVVRISQSVHKYQEV